jgi:hypothetical protein
VIALPFVLTESSLGDYLVRSRLTGAGRNGIQGADEHWDYVAADIGSSIFWKFLPRDFYYARSGMARYCGLAQVGLNIYHFFIRQQCAPRCLENLSKTFDFKHTATLGITTRDQERKTLEVLLIGYFIGIVFMPGADGQIQFWFTCLVPLVLGMVGLPFVMLFWIQPYFYPVLGDPDSQHYFLLVLVLYLLTVGPNQKLLEAA